MYEKAYKLYDRTIFDQLETFDLTKKKIGNYHLRKITKISCQFHRFIHILTQLVESFQNMCQMTSSGKPIFFTIFFDKEVRGLG